MSGVKGMHSRLSTSPDYAARVRARIRAGGIAKVLEEHVAGKRDMSPSQVTAGLGLLKKVVPDLTSAELSGPGGGPIEVSTPLQGEQATQILDRIRASAAAT
jgi:hypothetical protein